MPRPRTYTRRTDTKVRIREDQAEALQAKVEETGLSRNRLIEQAIDLLLEEPIRPRLQRAPADPKVVKASPGAGTRTKPRLTKVGDAAMAASEAAAAEGRGRVPQTTPAKTRRSPRPRL